MNVGKYKGTVFVLLAGLFWGTMGVFVNLWSAKGLGSVEIALIRTGSAALVMLLYLFLKDKSLLKIKPAHLWCFFGSGVCSLVFFSLCYFEAIKLSSMSVAAVLLYLAPVFVMLMSALLFKDKITLLKILAIFFSVGGCAFVSGIAGGVLNVSLIAVLYGVGSGFGYALYSIFSKYALKYGYSSLTITAYTFLFAFLALVFIADLGKVGSVAFLNAQNTALSLLTGVVSAVIPYVLYTKGLEYIQAGKASVIASVEPVCATVLSVLIYEEKLGAVQVVGIFLVIFSIVLLELHKKD